LNDFLESVREIASKGRLSAKMLGLSTVLDELQQAPITDHRVLVFTSRRATQDAIGAFLAERGIPNAFLRGGSDAHENNAAMEWFKSEIPGMRVLVSTEVGQEGLNLQRAKMVVNYDLPWNPMVLEQRIGRVQRLGSTHKTISVVNFTVAGSVEDRVVARL